MAGDISKLPKWAQAEFRKLADAVAHAKENALYWKGKALVGPDGSDTFVWLGASEEKPLGKGEYVRFKTGDTWHNTIDVHLEDGILRVRGAMPITIRPEGSNSLRITSERW